MQQPLCLLITFICSSLAVFNIIPHESARSVPLTLQSPVLSDTIGIQPLSASSNFKSKTLTDKTSNFKWNGGTILTHESNVLSWKGRSETSIASTRCGNLIFIAFNSAQGHCFHNPPNNTFCPGVPDGFYNGISHYTVSLDGGRRWQYMYGPPPLDTDIYTRGDPWLSVGGKSSKNNAEFLYFASIASNRSTSTSDHLGLSVHVARIIYKNNNPREKAINFEWIRASLIPKIQTVDFMDKEAIAAHPFDPNKAYLSYTLFINNRLRNIELYATNDAGVSWRGPVVLQETDWDLFPRWNQYSHPAVNAKGHVYVIWYEYLVSLDFIRTLKYRFVRSTDGGMTFTEPIPINPEFINFNPIAQSPIAYNRALLQQQPTMDVFTTCYRDNYLNRIIVAYTYSLNDAYDGQDTGFIDDNSTLLNSINIGISYSDDEGSTWQFIDPFTKPIEPRFVKRIFPTVSISSNGKSVNIGYLEIKEVKKPELPICAPIAGTVRRSLYHSIVDTYYIHSDNGGITWSDPIKLNDKSVDWCTTAVNIRPNYGDYMLSISDSKGGIQLAGVTNNFTIYPGFEPLTAVDVIYYHHSKKKCKTDKRRRGRYNALINREHTEKNELFADLKNEYESIEIDIPWTMIVIGICGIAICIASPYLVWMEINKNK